MSPAKPFLLRCLRVPWLLLMLGLGLCGGCKTTEDDMVERPWNAPKSWETGLPAGMLEGR